MNFTTSDEFLEARPKQEDKTKKDWDISWYNWLYCILDSNEDLWKWYRAMPQNADVVQDILLLHPVLTAKPDDEYVRRLIFRFLMRRYEFSAAWHIRKHSSQSPADFWYWYQLSNFLLPRQAIGVLAGFLLVLSSGELLSYVTAAADHPEGNLLAAATILVVLLMALAEVQRQVGRIKPLRILGRSLCLVSIALCYGALGALLIHWRAPFLGFCISLPAALHAGLLAVLLGFVFQHFWQDKSAGEPL